MEKIEETLGEKHKKFNLLLQDTIKEYSNSKLKDIDYNKPDLYNLLNIDIACRTRNVDYLIKVFKCQDMFYVSRAIKHSDWLITDPQYAHIINPDYLYANILPFMLTEAGNKLMLSIRLNLKDPKRYEEFFNYFEKYDTNAASKLLPYCSFEFMLPKLSNFIDVLPNHTLLRLFSSNLEIFRIYCNEQEKKTALMDKALFLMKRNGEQFFNILDSLKCELMPDFNAKYSKLAMKLCPCRIMFNFNHYEKHIDLPTFVKYVDPYCFEEFLEKYATNDNVCSMFNEERKQKILQPNHNGISLTQLIDCNSEDLAHCREILQNFKEQLPQMKINLKFAFQFLNIFMRKFKIHSFDQNLWGIYNDIFKEMNIQNYSKRNKTLQSYLKTIIVYNIIHKKSISEDLMMNFEFDTLKTEFKKFNEAESEIVFDFLYCFAYNKLETENDIDGMILWIERIFFLCKQCNKTLNNYPSVINKLNYITTYFKNQSHNGGFEKLYLRKKLWRKAIFNKYINNDSKEHLNVLKHEPNLLYTHERNNLKLSKDIKTFKNFHYKVRTYWPITLATYFKTSYLNNLIEPSSIIGLYCLFKKCELSEFLKVNVPNSDLICKGRVEDIFLCKNIAKNMHHCHQKLPIDKMLMYAKDVSMLDMISSLNSLLNSIPFQQFNHCFSELKDYAVLQKLCVWVAFSKSNIDIRKQMIHKIWQDTTFISVKTEIIKMCLNSLAKYKTCRDVEMAREEWNSLQFFMKDIKDEIIIRKLSSHTKRLTVLYRSEFYLKSYNLIKRLPPKCATYSRKCLVHYIWEIKNQNVDLLAEMIDEYITKRLWKTKLNCSHIDAITTCLPSRKSDEEMNIFFEKIVLRIFNSAYKMWDREISGLFIVRYNIHNILSKLCRTFGGSIESKPPFILMSLLDSLEKNISPTENYIMITTLKLAVEYCKKLSEYENIESRDSDEVYRETAEELAKICIKIFCEDVLQYGNCVWKLFYHALQIMLDTTGVVKSTQYKMYNCMLDSCVDLSPDLDVLVHILVMELSLYVDAWCGLFFDFDDEDYVDPKGQQGLFQRIKQHSSPEVQANYSKVFLSLPNNVEYERLSYDERFRSY